jgi:hypothetical protein
MDIAYLPADGVVAPGESAGFIVTITNTGKSNISALYLSTDPDDLVPAGSPTFVGPITYPTGPTDPDAICSLAGDGPLFCDLGTLVGNLDPDASVRVTVAFETPEIGTSWAFHFQAFGNGNTPSDGGTSHGDTLNGLASVTLNSSKNFAGGFSTDTTDVVESVQILGSKNIQAGKIVPPAANIPVTIEDGLADDTFHCSSLETVCTNRFGEWVRLNVAAGTTFTAGIHVTYTILGNKVPPGATTESIVLIHAPEPGETWLAYPISNRCDNPNGGLDPDANNDGLGEECILVKEVGKNFQVDAWLLRNGGSRLSY